MPYDPITILATCDLHYNIARSRAPAKAVAQEAILRGGDALVLVGDTAGADLRSMRDALRLFADFPGRKLLVPGNHCLWCMGKEDSLARYHDTLPRLASEEGFILLDHEPQTIGDVGLVGSVGWYDFSFRDRDLAVPLPFYRAKVSPGAAAYYGEHAALLDEFGDTLTEEHRGLTARWMDGVHVRLPMSDEEFADQLADTLALQLSQLAPRVERIVAFLHHLPFSQLVPRGRPPRFAFAAAYMGSARLGEVLLAEPKVSHVLCGHSHWPGRLRVGHIEAISIGSTYTEKMLEVVKV